MKHVYFSLTYHSISYIFAPASCYNSSHYTSACITTKSVVVLIMWDLNEGWENFRQCGLASKAFISLKLYLKILSELTCAGRGSEVVGNAVRNEWVFPLDDDFCCVCLTWCNRSGEQGTMRTDMLLRWVVNATLFKHMRKLWKDREAGGGKLISLPRQYEPQSLHSLQTWPLGLLVCLCWA